MNMHEKILDNLQELVYIADMETYELLYCNRALAEEFHIPQRLHGKCYEILQGRRDPCPFCTNGKLSQDGCYVWKFYNQLVGRHFLLSDSICEFNGRQVRTEIASDITEHVLLQEQLDKNLSLQNFINHWRPQAVPAGCRPAFPDRRRAGRHRRIFAGGQGLYL